MRGRLIGDLIFAGLFFFVFPLTTILFFTTNIFEFINTLTLASCLIVGYSLIYVLVTFFHHRDEIVKMTQGMDCVEGTMSSLMSAIGVTGSKYLLISTTIITLSIACSILDDMEFITEHASCPQREKILDLLGFKLSYQGLLLIVGLFPSNPQFANSAAPSASLPSSSEEDRVPFPDSILFWRFTGSSCLGKQFTTTICCGFLSKKSWSWIIHSLSVILYALLFFGIDAAVYGELDSCYDLHLEWITLIVAGVITIFFIFLQILFLAGGVKVDNPVPQLMSIAFELLILGGFIVEQIVLSSTIHT